MRGICRYSGKYHSESDTAGITFGNGIYDIGILFDVITPCQMSIPISIMYGTNVAAYESEWCMISFTPRS